MKTLTAQEFSALTKKNPAWASKLTEHLEITGHCDMAGHPITHLSTFLTFETAHFCNCPHLIKAEGLFKGTTTFAASGIQEIGEFTSHGTSTHFEDCPNLKVARGVFHGRAMFNGSGIEKIGDIQFGAIDFDSTLIANFSQCKNLKVAEGSFPLTVLFSNSGIERIGDLGISKANKQGHAARFDGCLNLKVARGIFPGRVTFTGAGVEEIQDLELTENWTEAEFQNCPIIKVPAKILNDPRFQIPAEARRRIQARLARKHLQKETEISL